MSEGGHESGVVVETGGGVYRVRLESGLLVEAALRGRLKLERRSGDKLVIGDRVSAIRSGDAWVVEGVEPRETELLRRGPGGRKPKVVAANLDTILVVIAAADPAPTLALIDRLLAVAEAGGVRPVLVVNKVDLAGAREVSARITGLYEPVGYRVVSVSVATGEGMEAFARLVCEGTTALVGPSGVGKSSLLNAVCPDLHLRIGDVSRRTGRGRHTTVSARLVDLPCGGRVADTPGFGDVGLWDIERDGVETCFPEIAALAGGCKFRGCAHLSEPGCAVLEAVAAGAVAASRYASYRTLREEA